MTRAPKLNTSTAKKARAMDKREEARVKTVLQALQRLWYWPAVPTKEWRAAFEQ